MTDDGTEKFKESLDEFQDSMLKPLTREQKLKMTSHHKDLYRAKEKEQNTMKFQLLQAVNKGDKYEFPVNIVDTDYDNFLITY